MTELLYFAYGSNMNPVRAGRRIPGAVFACVGVLNGYVVTERLYADIDRQAGGEVHGILYRMGLDDLARLDRYEGFPTVYGRLGALVTFHGKRVRAVTYRMTREAKKQREGMPYPEDYRQICSRGAWIYGIPNAFEK